MDFHIPNKEVKMTMEIKKILAPFPYLRIHHVDSASSYSVSICTDIIDKVQAFSSCFSPHLMIRIGRHDVG